MSSLLSTIASPADLKRLPFTTKAELVADQAENPPYGSNLTYPLERYCRLHQTSGTSGRPLRWLDTPESWAWMLDCWAAKFRFVRLKPGDRLFFPFSFGPFLGFWTAFEAAAKLGSACGSTTRTACSRCRASSPARAVDSLCPDCAPLRHSSAPAAPLAFLVVAAGALASALALVAGSVAASVPLAVCSPDGSAPGSDVALAPHLAALCPR